MANLGLCVCVYLCVRAPAHQLLFDVCDCASTVSAPLCRLTTAVSYLQGTGGEREEKERGHREREGDDRAREAGSDEEALSV